MRDKPSATVGTVYALADVQAGDRVKIGWSSDVHKRRMTIENVAGRNLPIVAAVPGTRADERAVHERLRMARMSPGEWFMLTPDVEAWIAETGIDAQTALGMQ